MLKKTKNEWSFFSKNYTSPSLRVRLVKNCIFSTSAKWSVALRLSRVLIKFCYEMHEILHQMQRNVQKKFEMRARGMRALIGLYKNLQQYCNCHAACFSFFFAFFYYASPTQPLITTFTPFIHFSISKKKKKEKRRIKILQNIKWIQF